MAENPTVSSGKCPHVQTLRVHALPVATAGNDLTTTVGVATYASTVTAVRYIPDGSQAGAATNNRTLAVVDQTSTDIVASLAMTANDAGHNLVAETAKVLTLSSTATNLNVAAGDVLYFTSTHVGTGIADPGGVVEVDLSLA
jgi:hypothetical protein